jgi:nicotinate-nucleotide pyrophosphorylase
MYGINLLKVAQILGAITISSIIFNKYGAIRSIYQEIVKYSAQQNIAMVKVMMQTLAQQNEQAYKDVDIILREHFTEEELREILPQ